MNVNRLFALALVPSALACSAGPDGAGGDELVSHNASASTTPVSIVKDCSVGSVVFIVSPTAEHVRITRALGFPSYWTGWLYDGVPGTAGITIADLPEQPESFGGYSAQQTAQPSYSVCHGPASTDTAGWACDPPAGYTLTTYPYFTVDLTSCQSSGGSGGGGGGGGGGTTCPPGVNCHGVHRIM